MRMAIASDCLASELIRKAKVPTLAGADAAAISAACDQCGDSLAGLRWCAPVGASMRAFAATAARLSRNSCSGASG